MAVVNSVTFRASPAAALASVCSHQTASVVARRAMMLCASDGIAAEIADQLSEDVSITTC